MLIIFKRYTSLPKNVESHVYNIMIIIIMCIIYYWNVFTAPERFKILNEMISTAITFTMDETGSEDC